MARGSSDLQRSSMLLADENGKQEMQKRIHMFWERAGNHFVDQAREQKTKGNAKQALDLLTEGLTVSNNWPEIRRQRAYLLSPPQGDLQEFNQGIESADQLLATAEDAGDIAVAKMLLSLLHLSRGNWAYTPERVTQKSYLEKAEKDFRKAIEFDPNLTIAKIYLGETAYRLGNRQEADKIFAEIVESDPTTAPQIERVKQRLQALGQ